VSPGWIRPDQESGVRGQESGVKSSEFGQESGGARDRSEESWEYLTVGHDEFAVVDAREAPYRYKVTLENCCLST